MASKSYETYLLKFWPWQRLKSSQYDLILCVMRLGLSRPFARKTDL
jgi:hypothetical protein